VVIVVFVRRKRTNNIIIIYSLFPTSGRIRKDGKRKVLFEEVSIRDSVRNLRPSVPLVTSHCDCSAGLNTFAPVRRRKNISDFRTVCACAHGVMVEFSPPPNQLHCYHSSPARLITKNRFRLPCSKFPVYRVSSIDFRLVRSSEAQYLYFTLLNFFNW